MNIRKVIIILTIFAFFPWQTPVPAKVIIQISEHPSAQIQRDILIMEKVLPKLIDCDAKAILDDRVQGMYLDGYGVLFDFQLFSYLMKPEPKRKIYKVANEKLKKTDRFQDIMSIQMDDLPEAFEDSVDISEKVKNIKRGLRIFYTDFASSIRSLKPNERISVNVRFDNPLDVYHYLTGQRAFRVPNQIRAVAQYADLQNYRRGALAADNLNQKIKIDEFYRDQARDNLEIIGGIFDAALQSSRPGQMLLIKSPTHSFYLEGYGALFFTDARQEENFDVFFLAQKEFDLAKTLALRNRKASPKDNKDQEKAINDLVDEILELIGQYGHTLTQVKDNEWVVITLNTGQGFNSSSFSKYFIKVRKAEMERFRKDEIDFDKFKKTTTIWKN